MTAASPYEVVARLRKTVLLADALDVVVSPGDDLAWLLGDGETTELVWAAARAVAQVRPPSAATRAEVVALLTARRAARARTAALADPSAGLAGETP